MTHRKHSHAFGTITLTVTACLLLWGADSNLKCNT